MTLTLPGVVIASATPQTQQAPTSASPTMAMMSQAPTGVFGATAVQTMQALPTLFTKQELRDLLKASGGQFPNLANGSTLVYGISGSGKSRMVDTAIRFAAEVFDAMSQVIQVDLGGFSTERVAFIRDGLCRVYDPRNHYHPMKTMSLLSQGAFPLQIDDPETGKAAPDVPLILPVKQVTAMICPQGHRVSFDTNVNIAMKEAKCPTCGVVTNYLNCTTKVFMVKDKLFAGVGHYAFDSITEANDWGLSYLAEQSVSGALPSGLLKGAEALDDGDMKFGSGSISQVGFMQNRTHDWLANIRSIPGQVIPATLTFGVEMAQADDDSGGIIVLGPQIAGNKRTAKMPRLGGACIHMNREPDAQGRMRHRAWLVNHLDPRDMRRVPYLSKHRGLPELMPDFLEDPWDDDEEKRKAAANTVCSLGTLYGLLIRQVSIIQERNKQQLGASIEALRAARAAAQDEIIGEAAAPAVVTPPPAPLPPMVTTGQQAQVVMPTVPPSPFVQPNWQQPAPHVLPLAEQAAKPITQQLVESLQAQGIPPSIAAASIPGGVFVPPTPMQNHAPVALPAGMRIPGMQMPPAPAQPPSTPSPGPAGVPSVTSPGPTAPGARRTPRPPVN